ncbi:MAG: hypothetical protein AB1730_18910 [Myxococcota bacterium]
MSDPQVKSVLAVAAAFSCSGLICEASALRTTRQVCTASGHAPSASAAAVTSSRALGTNWTAKVPSS